MICHCGKPVWDYDPLTLTCKAGHHTPKQGVQVDTIKSPEPAPPEPRFTLGPRAIALLAGAGSSLTLFVIEHLL